MDRICLILITFISIFIISNVNSQSEDSCSSNLGALDLQLPFDTTSFNCKPVWASQSFILRYLQTGPKEWSFVLSAPNANAYVGMGFSPNGRMVGSSAIVGWVGSGGAPTIKMYYLGGQSPAAVEADKGDLRLGNASKIVTTPSRIYMAFQLADTDRPESRLVYSVGPPNQVPGTNSRLSQHSDYASIALNYATGQTEIKGDNTSSLKRSHGVLVIMGWGILLAIGAMVGRYMRQWDPIWFYSHIAVQSLGFILGVTGIICGFVLSNRMDADIGRHKAIGVIVLVLGCLQVFAFLARPGKESKVRKYWNWYHHGLGRLVILLAAVNIFYGIHIAEGGSRWNAAYAVPLVLLFLISLVLEIRIWIYLPCQLYLLWN